jgi:type I restriction enzyme R subunit
LLKEAGWPLDQARDREFRVQGMPNEKEEGFVDYVLWGDDGKPLGLVEAKRTRRDPKVGQQQAKLYADCLEAQFGQRPLIFYSNGYEHWLWDDTQYPPRHVQGFLKKAEMELTIKAPMPGRLNTVSTTTDPPMSQPILTPRIVTVAINPLRRT